MKKLIFLMVISLLINMVSAQNVLIFQPSGGANDGTDNGGINAGKDTWANRYSPAVNQGADTYTLSTARSNCNTSDYKSFFQFNIDTLPQMVDSVFFGVTHLEHTAYCYSNCVADFYFYYVTESWDEMTLVQESEPMNDTTAFFGPLTISFPNDFQNQEYDITNAYNYWKTEGVSNYGFTIFSPTVGCNNAAATFNVWSSDDTIAINRPYLKIYYPSQTGIDENTLNAKVYPNPCGDVLKIEIDQIDHYDLTDITGRRFELPYSESTRVFDTSSLNSGVYILSIEKNNMRRSFKILKR